MTRRLNIYRFYLRAITRLLPLASFGLAALVCYWINGPFAKGEATLYLYVLLLTTVTWSGAAEHYGVTSVDELFRERTGIRAALSSWTVVYGINLLVLFMTQSVNFSRLLFVVSGITLLVLTIFMRAVFRHAAGSHFISQGGIRLLIIGTDDFAWRIARRLCATNFVGCRVEAYVRLPEQPVVVKGAPILSVDDLKSLDPGQIDDIIIALPPSRLAEIPEITCLVRSLCRPIRAVMDLGEGLFVRDQVFQFGRLQMLNLETTPAESPDYWIVKRIFDCAFAVAALLVTAPVMILIAILVKLTSPGPVFFRQNRVGLNGQVFSMLKFRTMATASGAEADTRWTVSDDPRRTWVGKFLRKVSLDELPQFFNVLKGDMSVVGPRPERPYFVSKFRRDVGQYNARHRLKVGITGWAQVNGWRGDTSIQKRVEHDLYYLQNWSLTFDLRIILMTVLGLFGKNAY